MDFIGIWENKEKEKKIKISKAQSSDEFYFQYYNIENKAFDEDFHIVDIYNNDEYSALLQNKTKNIRITLDILSPDCIEIGDIIYKRLKTEMY